VAGVRQQYGVSERHACRLLFQWRGTQRYLPTVRDDEDALTKAIIALASEYGRYGYRRITALLRGAGWSVGRDRVERIWRHEGLKVPRKQKPRGRLWLNDGSCVRVCGEFELTLPPGFERGRYSAVASDMSRRARSDAEVHRCSEPA